MNITETINKLIDKYENLDDYGDIEIAIFETAYEILKSLNWNDNDIHTTFSNCEKKHIDIETIFEKFKSKYNNQSSEFKTCESE